ncbi:MAG: radical SAM protein [Bacilli bacterium]|nr:radical SAM protein [Bacilli bacterium]
MNNKYIIVVDLLLYDEEKNKYLLCKKKNDKYFQLPGGHLKYGDDLYDGIIYYTKKQLDISLDRNDLNIKHTMIYPDRNKIFYSIEANYKNQKIDLSKSSHYFECDWFENNDTLIIDDKLKQVMKNVKNNNLYSVYGDNVMKEAVLRQESFGGTYFCFNTNTRYYLNEEETKNIIENGIYPEDFKEKDCIDKTKIKYIPMDKDENPIKFTFSDVVFIEVTRACNLQCKHCLNNSGTRMKDELNKEETETLIRSLAKAGVSEIRFTGGEPLLNENIYDYISLCTKLGLSTSIGTNGTLINGKIINKLKEAGLKRSVVSLDGTEEIHDDIRGKGNFQKSFKAINLLKEAGIDVRVNAVIMKNNIEDVIALAKFLDQNKIKLYIRRFIESGRGLNLTNYGLTLEDYDYVREQLKEELKGKYIDGHYLKSSEVLKKFRVDLPFEVTGCRAGQRSFCITPNGDIFPCGFLAAQGYEKVENVRNITDWRKFWNDLQQNKKLCALRNDMIKLNHQKITCMAYLYSIQDN